MMVSKVQDRRKISSGGGFTLVELIVVIVVILVLSAVLVPNVLSYIEKANLARANANANTAYKYVVDYITQCYENGNSVSLTGPRGMGTDAYTGTPIQFNGEQGDFQNYIHKCLDPSENYVAVLFSTKDEYGNKIITGEGELLCVTWAASRTDNLVGCYPTPAVGRSSEKYYRRYYIPNLGDMPQAYKAAGW